MNGFAPPCFSEQSRLIIDSGGRELIGIRPQKPIRTQFGVDFASMLENRFIFVSKLLYFAKSQEPPEIT